MTHNGSVAFLFVHPYSVLNLLDWLASDHHWARSPSWLWHFQQWFTHSSWSHSRSTSTTSCPLGLLILDASPSSTLILDQVALKCHFWSVFIFGLVWVICSPSLTEDLLVHMRHYRNRLAKMSTHRQCINSIWSIVTSELCSQLLAACPSSTTNYHRIVPWIQFLIFISQPCCVGFCFGIHQLNNSCRAKTLTQWCSHQSCLGCSTVTPFHTGHWWMSSYHQFPCSSEKCAQLGCFGKCTDFDYLTSSSAFCKRTRSLDFRTCCLPSFLCQCYYAAALVTDSSSSHTLEGSSWFSSHSSWHAMSMTAADIYCYYSQYGCWGCFQLGIVWHWRALFALFIWFPL